MEMEKKMENIFDRDTSKTLIHYYFSRLEMADCAFSRLLARWACYFDIALIDKFRDNYALPGIATRDFDTNSSYLYCWHKNPSKLKFLLIRHLALDI